MSTHDISQFQLIAEQAIRQAGQLLVERMGQFTAREKSPKDLVTDVDMAAQRVIEEQLKSAFPTHAFLGEEDDGQQADSRSMPAGESWIASQEYCWIVDPIDGTTNYVHQVPFFSVSIALWHYGQPLCGMVLDPLRDELFSASTGQGVTLNGQAISVSATEELQQSLVAVSFPPQIENEALEVRRFQQALRRCQAVRRMGSAALNLSYLAAGRLDGYWASSVQPWDVAAGILFVREAGGMVTAIDGGEFQIERPILLASASEVLQQSLLQLLGGCES